MTATCEQSPERVRDRIRALAAQEKAYKDLAAAIRREITVLQWELSSVDSGEQKGYSTLRNR